MFTQAHCANPNCLNSTPGTKAWYCKRCDVGGCEACHGIMARQARNFEEALKGTLPDYVAKDPLRFAEVWFAICKKGHSLGEADIAYRKIERH